LWSFDRLRWGGRWRKVRQLCALLLARCSFRRAARFLGLQPSFFKEEGRLSGNDAKKHGQSFAAYIII
jgi:hypothetical protein